MALWQVDLDPVDGKIKLLYVDHPGASDALVKRCGECEVVLEREVEAFACEEAEPWDRIVTSRGAFVRQASPAGARV